MFLVVFRNRKRADIDQAAYDAKRADGGVGPARSPAISHSEYRRRRRRNDRAVQNGPASRRARVGQSRRAPRQHSNADASVLQNFRCFNVDSPHRTFSGLNGAVLHAGGLLASPNDHAPCPFSAVPAGPEGRRFFFSRTVSHPSGITLHRSEASMIVSRYSELRRGRRRARGSMPAASNTPFTATKGRR